jgi:fatty acid desaturase
MYADAPWKSPAGDDAAKSPAGEIETVPRAERLRGFGDELDALKHRTLLQMGPADVAYVQRVDRFSHGMEIVGRLLIHFSFEPVGFLAGVFALIVHKQLQTSEIGHTTLHGTYDRLEGAHRYSSKTFRWDVPIDEESWRYGHNVRHHGNTNIAGKDADIHFGVVRLTEQTPYVPRAGWKLPLNVVFIWTNFAFVMNSHFTGLNDVFLDNGLPGKLDFLPDRSPESVRVAWKKGLRKYVPYYLWNYVFFPALAGPFFWKVLLGNWLAETARDVYSAATIWCGHVGEDVKSWPEGTKARGRDEWYAMQVEASNDFQVRWPISVLCGGLDMQIEHHLFPTLPPQRLRAIVPEVRDICRKYGVAYKTDSWGRTLRSALRHIVRLARGEDGTREVMRAAA